MIFIMWELSFIHGKTHPPQFYFIESHNHFITLFNSQGMFPKFLDGSQRCCHTQNNGNKPLKIQSSNSSTNNGDDLDKKSNLTTTFDHGSNLLRFVLHLNLHSPC